MIIHQGHHLNLRGIALQLPAENMEVKREGHAYVEGRGRNTKNIVNLYESWICCFLMFIVNTFIKIIANVCYAAVTARSLKNHVPCPRAPVWQCLVQLTKWAKSTRLFFLSSKRSRILRTVRPTGCIWNTWNELKRVNPTWQVLVEKWEDKDDTFVNSYSRCTARVVFNAWRCCRLFRCASHLELMWRFEVSPFIIKDGTVQSRRV